MVVVALWGGLLPSQRVREKNDELIEIERSLDGLYLLHTSLEPVQCGKERVLGNYKNLLAVEGSLLSIEELYGLPACLSLASGSST